MRRSIIIPCIFLLVTILGAGAILADNPRPDGCERCGNEFKDVQPSSCGFEGPQVNAYRANGEFIALFDNRCFACTMNAKTFCTVATDIQAASVGETQLEEPTAESGPVPAEAVFVEPCNRGQCRKDYRECLEFCSKNTCIIDCETRLQICLDECG